MLETRKSDYDEARSAFQSARELLAAIPSSPEGDRRIAADNARADFCLGRSLLVGVQAAAPSKSIIRQSSNALERAIQSDPGLAESYNALGIVYLEDARAAGSGSPQQALSGLREAARQFERAIQ